MSIQIHELRFGNWVQDSRTRESYQTEHLGIEYNSKLVAPIPLAFKILKECGFKNVQGDYWMKDNDLMLVLDNVWWWTNSWEMDGEFGYEALAAWREIEHLHQLQNLYFAITGKELNYNPCMI